VKIPFFNLVTKPNIKIHCNKKWQNQKFHQNISIGITVENKQKYAQQGRYKVQALR
jgi:hypothetical protein